MKFERKYGKGHVAVAIKPDPNSRLPEGWTRRLSGVSLCSIGVWYPVFVSRKRQDRVRSAAAWICMLAVGLLYAPMAGAALVAYGVDCCVGGFCNIPEHHHHKSQPAPAQDTAPMDCGHDMSGMTSCSMSCCKDPARPALIPGHSFCLRRILCQELVESFVPSCWQTLWKFRVSSNLSLLLLDLSLQSYKGLLALHARLFTRTAAS